MPPRPRRRSFHLKTQRDRLAHSLRDPVKRPRLRMATANLRNGADVALDYDIKFAWQEIDPRLKS
jgi:hypothetical protein